ncbi:uncharacterized protein EV420DRAFT_1260273 [Desarmillaria tabescens]|uniref:Glycosyltransferase 61 catalytic domain-containing protein n=1 Tax=Armillaria tabescens TaxID=1929756 RepID=A0AA39NJT8_ARMTA|nr:uncharacterized protein EV420DRAFT_1260273 [Desarmillaria tabescens]KAK0466925.1 hypothetical protein EV420DRAFT_1260273 [Desarmillaria tabescens]
MVASAPKQRSYGISDYLRLSTTSSDTSTLPSAAWTPLSLSTCTFGMPAHYAPCVMKRLPKDVVYAEELLYPAFEIRQPYFATEEHEERWKYMVVGIKERAVLQDNGWVVYKGQSGQNFVFNSVSFKHSVDGYDRWTADACMGGLVSSERLQPFNAAEVIWKNNATTIYRNAMVALSPDSYSFQHHLDRITHIVTQGAHLTLRSEVPFVITGRRGSDFVQQLWERLGFDEEHVLHSVTDDIYAERMIFSCRAILVHPWLSLKTLETFGINVLRVSSTRNKVCLIMYMSRSNSRAQNGGRKVINESALLDAIRELLEERGKGEELVVFDETRYGSASELFTYFNENVMAIIGPHGGAMHHHRWAARGTLVVEMMPTTFTSMAIYEEASVLSQTYAVLVVEPSELKGTDMVIDPGHVLRILREHLGVRMHKPHHAEHMGFLALRNGGKRTDRVEYESLAEDPLRISYQWGRQELGL